jgi:hypothetical protein
MAFLSSLFQGSTPQPVAGPAISAQGIPKELAPYYKDILGKAQALYNEKTAEGFKPYTGPTIAEFTPEQQQAFTGIAGLQGQQAPIFQEGMQMTREAAAPITGEQITSYMSPYQQAVTDIEKREATKLYESQVQPQLAAQAAKIQPFGGSRQGILEGMAADTQQRLLADIQAKGSAQGYQDAVKRLQAERQAQGQAGAQLATMTPNLFKAQLGELGAMQTVGEQKQSQSQTALDEAFRQYQLEKNYPYDIMSKYQSTVTGAPIATTQFAPPQPPAPSTAQTLLGGLGTLVGTYGAFGGKMPNLFPSKEGGGIADNMVYRQTSNQVGYPIGGNWGGDSPYPHPDIGGHEKIPNKGKYGTGFSMRELLAKYNISPEMYEYNTNYTGPGYDPQEDPENIYSNPSVYKMSAIDPPGPKAYTDKNRVQRYLEFIGEKIRGGNATDEEKKQYNRDISALGGVSDDSHLASLAEKARENNDTITVDETETIIPPQSTIKLPEGITSLIDQGNLEAPPQPRMPNQIEGPTRRDKWNIDQRRIQAEENSLMELMKERTKGKKEQLTESKEAQTRANWLNVAQLFSRMGTASPKQGGLMGVIGAGLEAADQTLPQFAATNAKFRDERKAIQNDIEDDKIDQARVKLGALEKRVGKEHDLYLEEREERRYDREEIYRKLTDDKNYALKLGEYNLALIEANTEDPTMTKTINDNFDNLVLGMKILDDGTTAFFDGVAMDEISSDRRAFALKQYQLDVRNPKIDVFTAIENARNNFKNWKPAGFDQAAALAELRKDPNEDNIQGFATASGTSVEEVKKLLKAK